MSKFNILSILIALIDKSRNRHKNHSKKQIDDWTETVFKGREPFNLDELDNDVSAVRRSSQSETSEDDFKDNVNEVRKFLLSLKVPTFTCK